ncbi:MAG: hypothetical protein HY761_07420 [Candidatus Omnitrophica bacterium]|nr:hypothetical protein [Candidatus Omnitrophota bacterium]
MKRYVHGAGIDEPVFMETSNQLPVTRYYYQFDGLGSVTALIDENGNIAERYSYDAYNKKEKGRSSKHQNY